jgi:hypothetical protein
MSHQMVGIVIDRLLDDEDLRARFARNRIETLADLNLRGFELSPEEFEAFLWTDAHLWLALMADLVCPQA